MQVPNYNGLMTEEAPPAIHLELKARIETKIKSLIRGIKVAALRLPAQHQDVVYRIISEWEIMFFSMEQADSLIRAKAILFLRFNNIEYIMCQYVEDPLEQAAWMRIYDEFEVIVREMLPKGEDSVSFIEAERQKLFRLNQSLKSEVIVLNIERVHTFFKGIEQVMCQNAERDNLVLQQELEAIKQDLLDLNAQRIAATDKLHGKMDVINKKVMKVLSGLETKLKEVQEVEKKMRTQENILAQLLDQAESVLRKV